MGHYGPLLSVGYAQALGAHGCNAGHARDRDHGRDRGCSLGRGHEVLDA